MISIDGNIWTNVNMILKHLKTTKYWLKKNKQ